MKRPIWFLLLISMVIGVSLKNASAQQEPLLISGPMLGYSEHRSVLVWYEVSQSVKTAMLRYWEKDLTWILAHKDCFEQPLDRDEGFSIEMLEKLLEE